MAFIAARILNRCNKLCLNNSFKRMLTYTSVNYKIFKVQDEQDFEERVVKSEEPVIVDFQAGWCGPCKILEPRLENIIGSKNDKIHLAKVDIDEHAELAMKYDVSAVPHVLSIKNGKPHSSFVGVRDEDEIEAFVDEVIGK